MEKKTLIPVRSHALVPRSRNSKIRNVRSDGNSAYVVFFFWSLARRSVILIGAPILLLALRVMFTIAELNPCQCRVYLSSTADGSSSFGAV